MSATENMRAVESSGPIPTIFPAPFTSEVSSFSDKVGEDNVMFVALHSLNHLAASLGSVKPDPMHPFVNGPIVYCNVFPKTT